MHALALAVLLTPIGPEPFDFYTRGPYANSIPRPEKILGYQAGERTTNFRDQERVLLAIAEKAKDRVRMFEYGKTAEGRPLRIFAITNPDHLKRLDDIRSEIAQVAQAKEKPKKTTPVIVWINECIHGNESASFESAMWLFYTLAASRSEQINATLSNTVVILNPVYNPDGHERFAVWFNSISAHGTKAWAYEQDEPVSQSGRLNHYRFDMNRDRVAMSQIESIAEAAEFRKWNPQVYVDQHGQVSTYFFPPCPMSINVNVGRERYAKWTETFGKATASAFDERGWRYFVGDSFDLYYPGYLDSYASLSGAIGMTHETDGGGNYGIEERDGSTVWLLDGIKKHFVSALAVIETSAEKRQELLDSFATFKRDAVSGKASGKFQRVIVSGSNSPRAVGRFAKQLDRLGINYRWATRVVQQEGYDYWGSDQKKLLHFQAPVGSLIIDMAQPLGPLAKSLLEPDSDFEPKFSKDLLTWLSKNEFERRHVDSPGFYDMTGWCLIYAHGLKAWWCENAPDVETGSRPPLPSKTDKVSKVGWYLHYEDQNDILAIADLLNSNVKVSVAPRPMEFGGEKTSRGTFLIFRDRNLPNSESLVQSVGSARGAAFRGFSTSYPDSGRDAPGSESIFSLRKPSIAMVWDSNGFAAFGPSWFLFEREWGLPFDAVSPGALSTRLDQYTAVLVPGGRIPVTDRLKDWIRSGGCLIVTGSIDSLNSDGTIVKLDAAQVDGRNPEYLPGTLFRAVVDPRHWLGFGIRGDTEYETLAVPVDGSRFFKAPPGGSVVQFASEGTGTKLLSGWSWPNNTERGLSGALWAHVAPFGRGCVVLFPFDPAERAQWPGLYKLLLNALILGPR